MFVPLPFIVVTFGLIALLVFLLVRRSGIGDEMVSRQRGDDLLTRQRRALPPARPGLHDMAAVMARPEVAAAMQAGNRIEAIKRVRKASGLSLREAKELVERHAPG